MIVLDTEVFKHDWMICWLDCETRKRHSIVNDKDKLQKFYDFYKHRIWVGYNIRGYDQWIIKAILCDFNPYEMSKWIVEKEMKGYQYSQLLSRFPMMIYDCIILNTGLKQLEGFMGHDIRETTVPFNIDRKLTPSEIEEVKSYCHHDVMEAFHVFVETAHEFESHMGLIHEYKMPMANVSKTKAQLSAIILGAWKKDRSDEFDITIPDTLRLGKYEWIAEWYVKWASDVKNYKQMKLETEIAGVPHTFGIGGLHGAIPQYMGEGTYIMADVGSYYPALMIEYDFLSRNVANPKKFRQIRDERLEMKARKDPRQQPRKIVLNGTYGASKDKYNNLYDPLQANNVCISGQLFLVDLIDKLEQHCQLIQSNTDGILVKLYDKQDKDKIIGICEDWCKRTRMTMEYDVYNKVFQKDVNNYIIIPEGELYDTKGKERFKRKGAYAKQLSVLDNDLPIVNRALVDYFVKGIPVEHTVMASDKLIDFQKIVKVSHKYEYGFKEHTDGKVHKYHVMLKRTVKKQPVIEKVDRFYTGTILHERVHRCFASKLSKDGTLYKKAKVKTSLDKIAGVPDKCFIINENIENMPIPSKLDKQWYIDLAKERIKEFVGKGC